MQRTRLRLIALNLGLLLLLLPILCPTGAFATGGVYAISVDGTFFYSDTNKSGSGWVYYADSHELDLTDYNGGPIEASGDLNVYCYGNTVITGSSAESYGRNAVTVDGRLDLYCIDDTSITGGSGSLLGGEAIYAYEIELGGSKSAKLTVTGGSGSTNGAALKFKTSCLITPVFATLTGGGASGSAIINGQSNWRYSYYAEVVKNTGHIVEITPRWYGLYLAPGDVRAHVVGGIATYTDLFDYYPHSKWHLSDYLFEADDNAHVQVAWSTTAGNLIPLNGDILEGELTACWESVAAGDILYNGLRGQLSDWSMWKKETGSAVLPEDLLYSGVNPHLLAWSTSVDPKPGEDMVLPGQWYAPGSTVTGGTAPLVLYGQAKTGSQAVYDPTEGSVAAGGNILVQGNLSASDSNLTLYTPDDTYFTAPEGYYLAGWSRTKGGDAEILPGEAVKTGMNGTLMLYAVWAKIPAGGQHLTPVRGVSLDLRSDDSSDDTSAVVTLSEAWCDAHDVETGIAAFYDGKGKLLQCGVALLGTDGFIEISMTGVPDTAVECKIFSLNGVFSPAFESLRVNLVASLPTS